VTLASIKALAAENHAQKEENARRRHQVEDMLRQLAVMEARKSETADLLICTHPLD
jgi:hypothetical protein